MNARESTHEEARYLLDKALAPAHEKSQDGDREEDDSQKVILQNESNPYQKPCQQKTSKL